MLSKSFFDNELSIEEIDNFCDKRTRFQAQDTQYCYFCQRLAAKSLFFTDEDHRKEFFIDKVATQFYPFDVHAGTDRTDGVKRHPECYCDRVYAMFSLTAEQRAKIQAMSYLALEAFCAHSVRDWAKMAD